MSAGAEPSAGGEAVQVGRATPAPRILFLTQLYPPVFGGGALFLANLRRSLARRGWPTRVIAGNRGIEESAPQGIDRVSTPGGEKLPRLGAYAFALLAPAALIARRRDYDIIHTLGNTHSVYTAVLTAKLLGKKIVIASIQNRQDDPGGILRERFGRAKNRLFSAADRFICCNTLQVSAYRAAGYPAEKVRFILNGIETARFFPCSSAAEKVALRRKLGLPADGFVVVSVGAIIHRKGMDLLAQGWKRFRAGRGDGTLVLAGPHSSLDPGSGVDDAFVSKLKNDLAAGGVAPSVIFAGKVSNVSEYLRCADAFALMSRGEGFPFALLEAMSSGLPFLMWDLPDYGGYSLTDGVQGCLIPPFEVERLAQRIAQLADDAAMRSAMGARGRALALTLDLERCVEDHMRVYRELGP